MSTPLCLKCGRPAIGGCRCGRLGNGFTKDGSIAGDYLEAGCDPNVPRKTPEEIELAIQKVIKADGQDQG